MIVAKFIQIYLSFIAVMPYLSDDDIIEYYNNIKEFLSNKLNKHSDKFQYFISKIFLKLLKKEIKSRNIKLDM